ncbi:MULTISPECIES: branched-chain amino acid ABC transporter permease [Agromyces]|jgi:branched-chain amino acid transport system permease protein|uniref:Branched-chain amino acid ABC transporter permease n=1 Tax=Agromyces mediolanus TaxID=41986 RepID=A0A918CFI8_AGRME|nr:MULTISPECIES: branched-chain amino acid ABC transporter permease [Agromyces]MCD1571987.1 branched-chain amino acid ABC transporter permease [Agromyces mediolanus]GGR21377.1 branched-chain amino acid ABC transporter permease [Agromyces mediolanus]GLJ73796.1 branched-chain amino acid ABC transporter permease [Agromyces mediolanus]GLU89435.1 branched-chain amino acid ABC transporter permease [Agromyces sp. NBRC 114283]
MLQGALAGLAAGGLYAVLAVCLTLMSRLVRVVNFSQAATGMFGGFVAVWLVTETGLPIWLGSVLGVLLAGVLSGVIGWIAATWLSEADTTTRSAMTVGPLLLLISLSFILFGNKPQPFASIISGPAFTVGGVVISQVTLVTVSLAIVVAVAVRILLTRTAIGTRLRALSERPTTAELLGIPSKPLSIAVWVVTGVISAIAIVVVAPTQSNDAISLAMLIVPAAAAALLGGFKRLDLAVVGGLVLGVLSGLVAQIDEVSLIRNFLPFLFIVVLLLWTQRKEVWDAAR